ncbi:MAG: YqgE/AlgH family protein [Halopseudomonas sp.]
MPRKLINVIRSLLVILCLVWLLPVYGWSFLKDKSATHAPAVGKLLVAMPGLNSPHFASTVILLVRYSAEGAVGLIINRPTRLTLANEFQGQVGEQQGRESLYWGGPMAMDRRVMLLEYLGNDQQREQLEPVFESIYLANSRLQFQQLLKQEQPEHRFRVFAGYAGWGASQLEREIVRGDWLVLPGNAELVMQQDAESIWPQLMSYQHGQMAANSLTPTSTLPPQSALF